MKKRIDRIKEAMSTGPRLTDEERLWCKRNEITPAILRGDEQKIMVFVENQHTPELDLCRAIMEKFPESGLKRIVMISSDQE